MQVMPLELLVTRMQRSGGAGLPGVPAALLDAMTAATAGGAKNGCKDWHTYREFFVSHTIRYEGQDKKMVVLSYKDWGTALLPADKAVQKKLQVCTVSHFILKHDLQSEDWEGFEWGQEQHAGCHSEVLG